MPLMKFIILATILVFTFGAVYVVCHRNNQTEKNARLKLDSKRFSDYNVFIARCLLEFLLTSFVIFGSYELAKLVINKI